MFESAKDGTLVLVCVLLALLLVLDFGAADDRLESVLITRAGLQICQPRGEPVDHVDTKEVA